MGEFPLHRRFFQRGGQPRAKPLEQDPQALGWLADTTLADHWSGSRRQPHIDEGDLRQGLEDLPRLVAQSRLAATRGQSLPERAGQEANRNVRLHAIFFMAPHWADRQAGLVNAKRRIGLGQLDAGPPQIFGTPELNRGNRMMETKDGSLVLWVQQPSNRLHKVVELPQLRKLG